MLLADIQETQVLEDLQELKEVEPNQVIEYLKSLVPDVIDFGINVLIAIFLLLIGRKVIKVLLKLLDKSFKRAGLEQSVINFISSILKVVLYVILILIIVDRFGIPTTSFITLIGSAGLAIGLALQGSLSNFAGGVLILVLKPFRVGDYIIENNDKNEGTVTEIDLFYTKLITFDNKVIVIPNGTLANTSLTNLSLQDKRRLDIKVGIRYDSDLKKAKDIILNILTRDDSILKDKDIKVYVDNLTENAVVIGCISWVNTSDYFTVKWRTIEKIKISFDENRIEIPYNNKLDVNLINTIH